MTIPKLVRLAVYHGFGRWLPGATSPGATVSKRIRRFLVAPLLASCGQDVNIEQGANFGSGRHVRLGDRSGVGVRCRLMGSVTIGANVMMGPDVLIMTGSHLFEDTTRPMCTQGPAPDRPVVIEDDVWIGTRVIVLPGVTIRRGSVIGAGSVVTRDVEPFAIVAGNPARLIRKRG